MEQQDKALIIGGSTGMGLDAARRLQARGIAVHLVGRRADRLETVASDDVRRARIWLAAAECAWAEGDASATRVWLGRAQTRFPDALAEAERARRVETLRRALESS